MARLYVLDYGMKACRVLGCITICYSRYCLNQKKGQPYVNNRGMTGSKTVKYSPLNLIVMTKVTCVAVFVLSSFALYFSVLGKNCLTISKRPGYFIGGKKNIHEARIHIHSIFFYLY